MSKALNLLCQSITPPPSPNQWELMDHLRCSFLPLRCTGFIRCAAVVGVLCACVWQTFVNAKKQVRSCTLSSGTISLDKNSIYILDDNVFSLTSLVGVCAPVKHHLDFHETTATRQASTDTRVYACVHVSMFEKAFGSKCQTNPQCGAAGGERCLCFLISLLLKKLLALSHVPSASGDNMTHAVVLV